MPFQKESANLLRSDRLQFNNLADDGGLYLTPFFVGLHDGGFDLASGGQSADRFAGLEALAEGGDTSGLTDRFNAEAVDGVSTTITSPGGFEGAPVFDPGESATAFLDVSHPGANRFFSFASMIIPSNDAFIGNLRARANPIFNRHGQFRGPVTIMVYGNRVWDAGTEVNNPQGGAAFSAEGGDSADENGRIRRLRELDAFIGSELPTGEELQTAFSRRMPIGRVRIDVAGSLED